MSCKRLFKLLLIILMSLLICGVFFLYIIESIDIIISEQADLNKELAQEVSRPIDLFEQNENLDYKDKPIDRLPDKLYSTENSDTHDVHHTKDTSESWRIIERSKNNIGQLQYYSPNNVSLDGERMVITTLKKSMDNKPYTSGMVESNSAYLYGRFSFVLSISEGKGLFPAIWLMPVEDKAFPEIDIFEMIGSEPHEFYGVLHYMDGSYKKRNYFITKVDKKDTYLIELEWTQECLRWFVDGECMLDISDFIPNEPMYLIINQAVGGAWAGSPDKTTVFPATFTLESWVIESEWSQPR